MRHTAVFIAALVCSAPCAAFTLETGKCYPATDVRAQLAVEEQQPIVVGNRRGYGSPVALLFTSNGDGSKGYAVRADKPLGQKSEVACIDSVYSAVRLNDIARAGIPTWVKMNDDPKRATAACKSKRLGYQEKCLSHDQSLANLEAHDRRVMFMATGTAINPRDNSVRVGQRLTVVVGPHDRSGMVDATTVEGANYMLSAYTEASLTQHGASLLDSATR